MLGNGFRLCGLGLWLEVGFVTEWARADLVNRHFPLASDPILA